MDDWRSLVQAIADTVDVEMRRVGGLVNIDEPSGAFVSGVVSSHEGRADAYLVTLGPETPRRLKNKEADELRRLGWRCPNNDEPQFHLWLGSSEAELPLLVARHACICIKQVYGCGAKDVTVQGSEAG